MLNHVPGRIQKRIIQKTKNLSRQFSFLIDTNLFVYITVLWGWNHIKTVTKKNGCHSNAFLPRPTFSTASGTGVLLAASGLPPGYYLDSQLGGNAMRWRWPKTGRTWDSFCGKWMATKWPAASYPLCSSSAVFGTCSIFFSFFFLVVGHLMANQ